MLWEELSVLNEVAEKGKKIDDRKTKAETWSGWKVYLLHRKTPNKGSVLLWTFISWDQENVSNSSSLFEKKSGKDQSINGKASDFENSSS